MHNEHGFAAYCRLTVVLFVTIVGSLWLTWRLQ